MTEPLRLLAIESATDWLSIAFFEGDACVLERSAPDTRRHAAALMPSVRTCIARDPQSDAARMPAKGEDTVTSR